MFRGRGVKWEWGGLWVGDFRGVSKYSPESMEWWSCDMVFGKGYYSNGNLDQFEFDFEFFLNQIVGLDDGYLV